MALLQEKRQWLWKDSVSCNQGQCVSEAICGWRSCRWSCVWREGVWKNFRAEDYHRCWTGASEQSPTDNCWPIWAMEPSEGKSDLSHSKYAQHGCDKEVPCCWKLVSCFCSKSDWKYSAASNHQQQFTNWGHIPGFANKRITADLFSGQTILLLLFKKLWMHMGESLLGMFTLVMWMVPKFIITARSIAGIFYPCHLSAGIFNDVVRIWGWQISIPLWLFWLLIFMKIEPVCLLCWESAIIVNWSKNNFLNMHE